MSERLTDNEIDEIARRFPTHMGEPVVSVQIQRLVAEVQLRRERELIHDQNHCLDCEGPLIQCTCQPDCPGGMCARYCHLRTFRPTTYQWQVIRRALGTFASDYESGRTDEDVTVGEARAIAETLDRLLAAGGVK